MNEAGEQSAEEFQNWQAPVEGESDPVEEKNLAQRFIHQYYHKSKMDFLDDIPPQERLGVIFDLAKEHNGVVVINDCCLKYIKDPVEQTEVAKLLFEHNALVHAIIKKELENVEPELVAAMLIYSGHALSTLDFFAYRSLDPIRTEQVVQEDLGGDPKIVLDSLKLLRSAANYYDKNNNDPNFFKFENDIKNLLQNCDLNPGKILLSWQNNAALLPKSEDIQYRNLALAHLNTIMALETAHSGNVKLLNDEYGIENFGRYGSEVLLNQIEENNDFNTEYGIAVFPQHDFNSAFGSDKYGGLHYERMLGYLQPALDKLGANLRIFEVSSKTEFYHKIMKAQKHYEATAGKIQFALLAGHGSPSTIQLGENMFAKNQEITMMDLLRLGNPEHLSDTKNNAFKNFKSAFADGADLILHSCSTGMGEQNIAKQISEVSNFVVTAPTKDAAASNLIPYREDGNIHLASYYAAEKRHFKGGQEIVSNENAA